ncbi:ATP-binding protein [Desulfuromonas thiophila]|uniref:ATP-binding protein n=1 Tax=Desulfuromonas thiophila TaxID=57664 RepID=UPI0024A7B7B5|nr:ATP-binding protein [Desulfuromonas thiophila]
MDRTAEDLLRELRAVDESVQIEVKRGSKVDRSVLETVCAFANEPGLGGGHLMLGVERDRDLFGDTYEVCGVSDPDKVQSELVTQCATTLNRPIRPQVSVEKLNGKVVIVAFIPESSPTDKPVYITSLGLPRGAFRRVGPTDQAGTDDDLIALYSGHQVDTYDASIIPDADMADIDTDAINDYRQMRNRANPDAEELSWPNEDLLRALGCVRIDNGSPKPTAAGILLFGTSLALRRCFPMMRIDYIRVPGRQWVEDPEHRFDTLEIRAPLLSAIRKASNAITEDMLKSFSLPEGALAREEEPVLPSRVIREAVVNAVMHRSYRIQGAIQIIRYANRLEIRNPGHSLKAEEQLGEPGSETRNPRIAAVLHEVNIAETKGSGIRAMRQLMIQHNLLPPTFESDRRPDQFVATFLFHHFLGSEDIVWLRSLTSEPLSDEEARALVFVREVGAIDNAAYRAINRTDTLDASTHLRRLRSLGLLVMKGSGSRTYYVPGAIFENPHQSPANTHHPLTNTHHPQSEYTPPLAGIPEELRQRIVEAGAKPRQDVVRGIIRDLCSIQPLSAEELCNLMGRRDTKDLVRSHLTPMREAGELSYTIPEMPNHPEQKYVAIGDLK